MDVKRNGSLQTIMINWVFLFLSSLPVHIAVDYCRFRSFVSLFVSSNPATTQSPSKVTLSKYLCFEEAKSEKKIFQRELTYLCSSRLSQQHHHQTRQQGSDLSQIGCLESWPCTHSLTPKIFVWKALGAFCFENNFIIFHNTVALCVYHATVSECGLESRVWFLWKLFGNNEKNEICFTAVINGRFIFKSRLIKLLLLHR